MTGMGASPTNQRWCRKTRVTAVLCGIKISAADHLVLSQYMHLRDRQMDRQNCDSNTVRCITCRTVRTKMEECTGKSRMLVLDWIGSDAVALGNGSGIFYSFWGPCGASCRCLEQTLITSHTPLLIPKQQHRCLFHFQDKSQAQWIDNNKEQVSIATVLPEWTQFGVWASFQFVWVQQTALQHHQTHH